MSRHIASAITLQSMTTPGAHGAGCRPLHPALAIGGHAYRIEVDPTAGARRVYCDRVKDGNVVSVLSQDGDHYRSEGITFALIVDSQGEPRAILLPGW